LFQLRTLKYCKKLISMAYDLIVVGTGFASTFFLKKYLESKTRNVKVLVLERGKFETQDERLVQAKNKPYGQVGYITSNSDQGLIINNNTPEKPWLFDPNFGGTSYSWTGCTPRFMPSDFQINSLYGVGLNWPISYDELEPFYSEAEQIMTVAGPDKTPFPKSEKYPLPPHALSSVDKILNENYGVNYISQPSARATRVGPRGKCCSSTICHLCPTNAKFTIENGMTVYEDSRVELIYDAQVYSLEAYNDHIKSVLYVKEGRQLKIDGDLIVLGANAIFNAHILLNCGDTNPNTGRYLSDQVSFFAYVFLDGLDNVGGGSKNPANGYMFYDAVDRSKLAASLIETYNDFTLRNEFGKWRKIAKFKFMFEDIPNFNNYILKSSNILVPEVRYHGFSDYVIRGYENLRLTIDEVFSVLPVEEIHLDENVQKDGAHIMGTTRMSKSADLGTVDENMMHHQYRNLVLVGGSVFPSISPTNPTLTISALSIRAASKLL
jgi:choline dehydrogenase-like flavoprotein